MVTRHSKRGGHRRLAAVALAATMVWLGCAQPRSDKRQRSSEPPVPETPPSAPDTQVERGARGARPEAPAPPVPSVEGGELPPPALPDSHAEALRAIHGRLGRLERRFAALDHPFGSTSEAEAHPVFSLRQEAKRDADRLEEESSDWKIAYIEAWRSLSDYQASLERVATEEGLRPRRVRVQPDTEAPLPSK